MNMEQAQLLLGPAVSLLMELVKQIASSVNMNEEQKKEALKILFVDLDAAVAKVKNVRFDAFKKAD